jgi:hypothetical protein
VLALTLVTARLGRTSDSAGPEAPFIAGASLERLTASGTWEVVAPSAQYEPVMQFDPLEQFRPTKVTARSVVAEDQVRELRATCPSRGS